MIVTTYCYTAVTARKALAIRRNSAVSDMIERVARALAECGEGEPLTDAMWVQINQEFWIEYARAAIGAMREPTDDMITAGDDPQFGNGPEIVVHIYATMIDAALKEKPAP